MDGDMEYGNGDPYGGENNEGYRNRQQQDSQMDDDMEGGPNNSQYFG
jgi:hypothetical protein